MTSPQTDLPAPQSQRRVTARALLLGDRIDTAGLERSDMISATPLAFHAGTNGFVALYRFGVAVMIGLSPLEEDDVLRQVKLRVFGPHEHIDDESAVLEISSELDDKIPPGGAIAMKDFSAQRLLVVADALAKSVSLGRDEREVNAVFDIIEPFAADLARNGRPPWKRRVDAEIDRPDASRSASRVGPRRRRGKAGCALGPARSRAALYKARR